MRQRSRRLRVFAVIWAVLQFALPATAALVDVRLVAGSPQTSHVEQAPGRDCAPSHSPDCAVCKHLSTSSVGSTHAAPAFVSDGSDAIVRGRIGPAPKISAGVALPRAPPRHA